MTTVRRMTHIIMLLVIALSAWLGQWSQSPTAAGQSQPVQSSPITEAPAPASPAALHPFGYGAAVAAHDWDSVQRLGFNWMQVYDVPAYRYPVNVLYRVRADANDWQNLWPWYQALQTEIQQYGDTIDAYQIGNEPNLTENGWSAPPDAYAYINLLCNAYSLIKTYDPTALVITAGLAPTGRVAGFWQGHNGHNGTSQDEREFLREFFAAGGGGCADAIGYHPLGFRADYDAVPDVKSNDLAQNCDNGFCFRGMEKIYDIMRDYGYGHEKIWATEVGWLAEPEDASCLHDITWQGRAWQRVTREKQTTNLAGAFRYAREHYPWLAAMFVFNLNFDQAPWYHPCEQMRFYSIPHDTLQSILSVTLPEMQHTSIYFPAVFK